MRNGAPGPIAAQQLGPPRPTSLPALPRARVRALLGALCLVQALSAAAQDRALQAAIQQPAPGPPPAPSRDPGTLAGTVMSYDGAMVANAQITVRTSTLTRQVTSDTNGQFTVPNLPDGPFTITVQLQGFSPVTENGELEPGQLLQLPPTVLDLAVVQIQIDAITPEQAALEQIHVEEHQRLVGVLPNFFVSYNWTAQPLTSRQKFSLATHNVLDPGNLALVGVVAGVQQASDAFPGYHQGAVGYSKRFGADLANLVVGTYMGGAVLPSLFHQDPRYFYKGTGTKRQRLLYALSRSVITRGDNGHDQPNFSGILGDLSAGAISNIYYPATDRQGATLFLENGILAIAGDAMNDIVQEFVFNHLTTRGKKKKTDP